MHGGLADQVWVCGLEQDGREACDHYVDLHMRHIVIKTDYILAYQDMHADYSTNSHLYCLDAHFSTIHAE
jgi:hypothetical protein